MTYNMVEIFKNMMFNVSLLVLMAFLITKTKMVRDFIINNHSDWLLKLMLIVFFGIVGIISTYMGTGVEGAIVNTRVVGVVAGGLLGGPVVGIGAGLIAGIHRWAIDIGGFTAVACAISTIVEGVIGGLFQIKYRRSGNDWIFAFCVAAFAECCQMAIILLVAKPFDAALYLVQIIAFPMIVFNSFGVALFVTVFNSVFMTMDEEAARRTSLAFGVANSCMPYMKKGLTDSEAMDNAVQIILGLPGIKAAVITDTERIVSCGDPSKLRGSDGDELPEASKKTLEKHRVTMVRDEQLHKSLFHSARSMAAIAAPLFVNNEIEGTVVFFVESYRMTNESEKSFADGMGKIFSTQLELSRMEEQAKLLERAEFSALQSQINPHFLFNCLSTISAFCIDKPERAKELLVVLGDYFRRTLQTGSYMIPIREEMEYVNAYLTLEKARFEDKLQLVLDVPENLTCKVPSFILQPIVENAVKHGAMRKGKGGTVSVSARKVRRGRIEGTEIDVKDDGPGIDEATLSAFRNGQMAENKIGLMNVHRRLQSIYGPDNGLQIETSPSTGTTMQIFIPDGVEPEEEAEKGGAQ